MLELGNWALNWLEALLLPMTRISAFFMAAPIFPQIANNVRVRIILALFLCFVMMPTVAVNAPPLGANFNAPHLPEVLNEAILGLAMGFVLTIALDAVVFAGEEIATAIGVNFAQAFDPSLGTTPVISQFLNIMALMIFITSGGLSAVIIMVTDSLRVLPPGSFHITDADKILQFAGVLFQGAALISAPLLLTLLSVNIGLGALARTVPSLNIFAVGFTVTLLLGFGLLIILLPVMQDRIEHLWDLADQYLKVMIYHKV
jgi:flagellar biosynthesis protein FliR